MEHLATLVASPGHEARLRPLLDEAPDVELEGEHENARDAVDAARLSTPALLILSAELPERGGLAVLDRLGADVPPAVIVLASSERYALGAFEAGVLDYLCAPFSDERFRAALDRARTRIAEVQLSRQRDRLLDLLRREPMEASGTSTRAGYHDRLVVKTGSQLVFLDPAEVDWIEAEGVYVRVHVGRTSYLLRESLRNVERRLDARRFLRIHRSRILNVERARKIVPHYNGGALVILHDGTQLKMSRSYRDRVSATLG